MEPIASAVKEIRMNVFINCPFDRDYRNKLFEALVFSVQTCGFIAKCALEVTRESARFNKIQNLIEECELSIHDLSRNDKGETPRFNMPLELGLFIGCKRFGGELHKNKAYLVLDKKEFEYQKYISDISGEDPEIHLNRPKKIIEIVRNWLCGHLEILYPGVVPDIPSGSNLYEAYLLFKMQKAELCREFSLDVRALTFVESRRVITEWWERGRRAMQEVDATLTSKSIAREVLTAEDVQNGD